jgi:hypothetical protein
MSFGAQIILPLRNIATGRDIAEFAPLAHVRRPEGGWMRWRWFWNTDQLFCSYPRVTNNYFSRISSDKVCQSVTSTSMSVSQAVETTATTLTISVSATITTTSLGTPTSSPSPASHDELHLIHDSVIIASVLGGFTILLIFVLGLAYFIYKRHKRHQQLDYSPPFTSLAPPPRSALSPLSNRSSQIPPEDPHETSLSMGPSIHAATEPVPRHSQGSAQYQPARPDRNSVSPNRSLPAILLQPSPPPVPEKPRPRAQSRLYHDLLREETEIDAARRHGRLDAPGHNTLRPLSGLSEISDIEAVHLRPSAENDRGRAFPSTRASSGVFPDD